MAPQEQGSWYTAADVDDTESDLYEAWPDVVNLTQDAAALFLEAARTQCQDFAPALDPAAPVPATYRLAQALQARALARAGSVGPGGSQGEIDAIQVVFPMDWTVKNLLRPARPATYFGKRKHD